MSSLQRLGWDDAWEAARGEHAELVPVRVAAEHRGAYHAIGEHGDTLAIAWAELPGKAYHEARDKRALPTVGDWALVERWAEAVGGHGAAVIRHVLPRRSFLVRRAAGEAIVPQPLGANIDVGIVMTSANTDLNPKRLDRYLALLRDGGITPVVAVSKLDLVADPDPVLAAAGASGAEVVGVSVVSGAGLATIRAFAGPGRTCVLLGSSGVGKSSLLNALIGTQQETREIRDDERGRHTTTRRELFVSDAGVWIDTPGMRELGGWVDEDDEPDDAFDDITELATGCRFRDCRHRDEPGCAVRGAVAAERLASYHKLVDEKAKLAALRKTAPRKRRPKPV